MQWGQNRKGNNLRDSPSPEDDIPLLQTGPTLWHRRLVRAIFHSTTTGNVRISVALKRVPFKAQPSLGSTMPMCNQTMTSQHTTNIIDDDKDAIVDNLPRFID